MQKIKWLLCIIFFACSGPSKKTTSASQTDSVSHTILNKSHLDTLNETVFLQPRKEEKINDSITRVELLDSVFIHWNTRTRRLHEDSLLNKIKEEFYRFKIDLANQIRNAAPTGIIPCPENSRLKLGDICFIVIDKIEGIPFAQLTNFQLDVIEAGCPHMVGLFGLLEKHRSYMTKCVKDFLYNQSKF